RLLRGYTARSRVIYCTYARYADLPHRFTTSQSLWACHKIRWQFLGRLLSS
ncbi:Homoserine O-acetyltransferase, partial [Haemophilus influenzae]